jgi:hypothetical protein
MLVCILAACAPAFTAGTVVEKIHEPLNIWYSFLPIKVGKTTVMIPQTNIDDEDWVVIIENESGETESIYVEQTVWETIQVGQYVDLSPVPDPVDSFETN